MIFYQADITYFTIFTLISFNYQDTLKTNFKEAKMKHMPSCLFKQEGMKKHENWNYFFLLQKRPVTEEKALTFYILFE